MDDPTLMVCLTEHWNTPQGYMSFGDVFFLDAHLAYGAFDRYNAQIMSVVEYKKRMEWACDDKIRFELHRRGMSQKGKRQTLLNRLFKTLEINQEGEE